MSKSATLVCICDDRLPKWKVKSWISHSYSAFSVTTNSPDKLKLWKTVAKSCIYLSIYPSICRYVQLPTLSVYFSWSHKIIEIGRWLWRSSGPTPLLKQGYLEQVAQENIRTSKLLWAKLVSNSEIKHCTIFVCMAKLFSWSKQMDFPILEMS